MDKCGNTGMSYNMIPIDEAAFRKQMEN